MEVIIKDILVLSKETSIFSFLSKKSFNKDIITSLTKILPCQNTKLSFFHQSVQDQCMVRYYSLINNPFNNDFEKNDKSIEFQMLIKENLNVNNSSYSLPNVMKKAFYTGEYKEAKIVIDYPYGSLCYLGNGKFINKEAKFEPKVINLISCGTGIAPIKQLISALDYENENILLKKYLNKIPDDNIMLETEIKVNLINITKPESVYFNEDFKNLFRNSVLFENKTAKDFSTSKIDNSNNMNKKFKFENYSLVIDDYYGALTYGKNMINSFYEKNKIQKEEYFFLCGTENMLTKVSSLLKEEFKVPVDNILYFY